MSSLSRQVVQVVRHLQEASDISSAELIRRSGISSTYYYARLRGEFPFDLDDLANLAKSLDVTPVDILTRAASLPELEEDEQGLLATLDGAELARRLRYLETTSIHSLELAQLDAELQSDGFTLDAAKWTELTTSDDYIQVHQRVLEAVAARFHVPINYLTDMGHAEFADRLEAEVDFDRAVVDHKVQRIAARALGNLDTAGIRALTAAIRD